MPRPPLEVTPEQYRLLVTTYDRYGFGTAMQQAITWGAAQQLEAICEWLTQAHGLEQLSNEAAITRLRREFQVGDPMAIGEDKLIEVLQAVANHLEASAHNCQRAGEGIQVLLKEIRRKRDA